MTAQQIKIKTAEPICTQDGNGFTIMAADADGRQYFLENVAVSYIRAWRLADKIKECGAINPDLWFCHVPYGTDAWMLDGMEARQIEDERYGYH